MHELTIFTLNVYNLTYKYSNIYSFKTEKYIVYNSFATLYEMENNFIKLKFIFKKI